VTELYLEAGIRSLRLSLPNGEAIDGSGERVRLALPSRVYTQAHLNYAVNAISSAYDRRHSIAGLTMIYRAPVLGTFTAQFERTSGDSDRVREVCAVPAISFETGTSCETITGGSHKQRQMEWHHEA